MRRVRSGEGKRLAEVRPAALAGSPAAFESTVDAEPDQPDEAWDAEAAFRSEGCASAKDVSHPGHDELRVGHELVRVPGG